MQRGVTVYHEVTQGLPRGRVPVDFTLRNVGGVSKARTRSCHHTETIGVASPKIGRGIRPASKAKSSPFQHRRAYFKRALSMTTMRMDSACSSSTSAEVRAGLGFCVHDTIVSEMPDCDVCHMGDAQRDRCAVHSLLLWRTSDGMACAVAVLDATVVHPESMRRIYNGLDADVAEGALHAIMVVAPRATAFPRVGCFHMTSRQGIPVALVARCGGGAGNMALRTALRALHCFWSYFMAAGLPEVQDVDAARRNSTDVHRARDRDAAQWQSSLAQMGRTLDSLHGMIARDQRYLDESVRHVPHTQAEIGDRSSAGNLIQGSKALLTEELVSMVMRHARRNADSGAVMWPTRSEANISEAQARTAGGYKLVLQTARDRWRRLEAPSACTTAPHGGSADCTDPHDPPTTARGMHMSHASGTELNAPMES